MAVDSYLFNLRPNICKCRCLKNRVKYLTRVCYQAEHMDCPLAIIAINLFVRVSFKWMTNTDYSAAHVNIIYIYQIAGMSNLTVTPPRVRCERESSGVHSPYIMWTCNNVYSKFSSERSGQTSASSCQSSHAELHTKLVRLPGPST